MAMVIDRVRLQGLNIWGLGTEKFHPDRRPPLPAFWRSCVWTMSEAQSDACERGNTIGPPGAGHGIINSA